MLFLFEINLETVQVRVSYLEIYNEDVRDLLGDQSIPHFIYIYFDRTYFPIGKDQSLKLEVKERPDVGVFVKVCSCFRK